MSEPLEGRRVPEVRFKLLSEGKLTELPSEALFRGRTVVLFALPGAFTPTCSNRHVPRFQELSGELSRAGVDEIVCLSVNDPYVMERWARELDASSIRFLPDCDAAFTRALGMLVDKGEEGLGARSRRYSLLVRDGTIEKAFVEPDEPGDPYTVSDADTLLRYLNPDSPALEPVALFAKAGCPFCARAKRMLEERRIPYETIEVGEAASMQAVLAVSGAATVPQVFVAGRRVGGAEELERYLSRERAAGRAREQRS